MNAATGFLFDVEQTPNNTKPKREKKPVSADITANRHKGHARSVEAHQAHAQGFKNQEARILDWLQRRGALGGIADEASQELVISISSASARFSELKAKELIAESKLVRQTRYGSNATVCVLPEFLEAANDSVTND